MRTAGRTLLLLLHLVEGFAVVREHELPSRDGKELTNGTLCAENIVKTQTPASANGTEDDVFAQVRNDQPFEEVTQGSLSDEDRKQTEAVTSEDIDGIAADASGSIVTGSKQGALFDNSSLDATPHAPPPPGFKPGKMQTPSASAILSAGVDDARLPLIPDTSANNAFKQIFARRFYSNLQDAGIPMRILSRFAAGAAQMPFKIYDDLADTGSKIGKRLQAVQSQSLNHLWKKANSQGAAREGLPRRCNRAWFCKVFLNGIDPGENTTASSPIWPFAQKFNSYDVVAMVAAIDSLNRYFDPVRVTVDGTTHEVIGLSEKSTGIKAINNEKRTGIKKATPALSVLGPLSEFMMKTLKQGIQKSESTPGPWAQPLLIISDDGKDLDDEVAKVFMHYLEQTQKGRALGYMAVLYPAEQRAQLAKGTLRELGMMNTPVFKGAEMGTPKVGAYEFFGADGKDLQPAYMAAKEDIPAETGVNAFVKIMEQYRGREQKITLVCLAGLKDASDLLSKHKQLFKETIGRVVIQGGVDLPHLCEAGIQAAC